MSGFTSSQIKSDMKLCERIGLGLSDEMTERSPLPLSAMEKLDKELRRSTRRLSTDSKDALKEFLNTSNTKTYNSLVKVLKAIPDSRYHDVVKDLGRNDPNRETANKMLALKKIIDRIK